MRSGQISCCETNRMIKKHFYILLCLLMHLTARAQECIDVADIQANEYSQQLGKFTTRLNISTTFTDIRRISILAPGRETLNGTLKKQENKATFLSATGAQTYRTSAANDVIALTGNRQKGTHTAYLLPVELTQGVMVTISTSDGKHYSQTFTEIIKGEENNLSFTQEKAENLWMATLPSNLYYNMLSTPGAHNAASSGVSGFLSSFAKCQDMTISELLEAGVRAFDLRPNYTGKEYDIQPENLTICHGKYSTGVLFRDAMEILVQFVKEHPTENVSIILNKEKSSGTDQSEIWRKSLRECFMQHKKYLIDAANPLILGDCRGKITIVSRAPFNDKANGVDHGTWAQGWPNNAQNTDFNLILSRPNRQIHATYGVEDIYKGSIDDKEKNAQKQFEAFSKITENNKYCYTFLSIAWQTSSLFTTPKKYAAKVNPRITAYIEGNRKPLGYVYADFMSSSTCGGKALFQAIVEHNWKYAF